MSYIKRINKVLDYIEQNITYEISYKEISCIAECSTDSFQRIFSYVTDLSIADYIRNRRLTCAAFDIINSNKKIIDIALKYGYSSPDSFTKAFHRLHGILPSEVRLKPTKLKLFPKLELQKPDNNLIPVEVNINSLQSNKGGFQMEIQYLEKHIICNEDEKVICMNMVNTILYLADLARKYGILRLEEELQSDSSLYQDELLKLGICLIVDGIDPDYVCRILENYLMSDNYYGQKFLEGIIIIEGILSIQQGYNSHVLKELLCSYFGTNFRTRFMELCKYDILSVDMDIKYKEQPCFSEKTALLNNIINMHVRSMQRLLRELDTDTISTALFGSDDHIIDIILTNMSKRTAILILSNMECINPCEDDIINAQKKIIEIASQLKKQGEIIWE